MCSRADDPSMHDNLCGLCLTCWPLPRGSGTACHDLTCRCHTERATATGVWAPKGLDRPHIPTTDYYDGRDGSIEAEDDDEDRIADQDRIMREDWQDYLEWQRTSH